MKLRNLFLSLLAGSALFITSCEDCEHEGDKSIVSSLQVGDVVCSDGSVLSKEKFGSSKKEPVAIVYYVNRNPEIKALGYAVSIRDVAPKAFADSLGGRTGNLGFTREGRRQRKHPCHVPQRRSEVSLSRLCLRHVALRPVRLHPFGKATHLPLSANWTSQPTDRGGRRITHQFTAR